jgi:Predicted integral membrane protein
MTTSEDKLESTPQPFKKRKNIVAFALFFLLAISGYFLYSKLFSPSDEVTIKSIAVLPFANVSNNANQEYFSDGVSEELIHLLAKFPELKLTGRATSFALKGKKDEAKTIGQKFGIEYLLEGSIQKDSTVFTIEARLMNALDGTQLWSKTYRSEQQDIFKVQDDITRDVVSELNLKLFPASAKSTKMNPEAFHLMLEGNFENRKGTTVSGFRSIQLFHRALALEPESSKIWGDLASAYALRARLACQTVRPIRSLFWHEMPHKNQLSWILLARKGTPPLPTLRSRMIGMLPKPKPKRTKH